MWTVGEREKATDREGAGKIDTMEERERDKSGRENKIERETGSVMSEKERDRVGRKIQKKILERETGGKGRYRKRERERERERDRGGIIKKDRDRLG